MEASIGHNSGETDHPSTRLAADQLRSIIERIENLDGQINELRSDQKDIYAEAKGNGYDVKALRTIVRMRAMDDEKRRNEETVLESYMLALGML